MMHDVGGAWNDLIPLGTADGRSGTQINSSRAAEEIADIAAQLAKVPLASKPAEAMSHRA
jgi:hypothetical protein